MNQRVEIYGTTRHDMNGKRGVATDLVPAYNAKGGSIQEQSRYTVRLDSGEAFRVRKGNVRAEPRAGAAGGKAKGKGKKGRGKGGQ